MLTETTTPGGATIIESVPGPSNHYVIEPVNVNAYGAMTSPALWCALCFIANGIARFPRAVRRDGAKLKDSGETHPLDKLLKGRPNAYRNAYIFWRTWVFHAALRGNGYAWVQRGADGAPLALHNLAPENVYPVLWTAPGEKVPAQWYVITASRDAAVTPRLVPSADMLHLQSISYNGTAGIDPVQMHQDTIARGITIDRYLTKYLQTGTNIRGSIEFPKEVPPERLEQILQLLRSHFFGATADRDVLMLTDGATLKNATQSPHDGQLVQQQGYTTKQIAQITGVPPEFLYELTEAKYNQSVEQAGINVVRYTFGPWIEQIEDELTSKLLSHADQDAGLTVALNPDALLRGDTQTQTTTVMATVTGGVRSRNEGRAVLGLPATDDPADDKLQTLGSTSTPPAAAAKA